MKISLAKPIETFGKKCAEIELREPSGYLYIKLGDPRLLVFNPSGSGYWIEQPEIIRAYFETIIDHEMGADVISLLSLEDAMALKEGLFSFFTGAAERLAKSK